MKEEELVRTNNNKYKSNLANHSMHNYDAMQDKQCFVTLYSPIVVKETNRKSKL